MKLSEHILHFLIVFLLFTSHEAMAAQNGRFECNGSVEAEVWEAWDANIRDLLNLQLLHDRLLKQGDVYALYDFQTYTHNMVSMARRCNRSSRLLEVADLVRIAYGALEPGTLSSPGRRWVCHGGTICNDKNHLLNTEVMLDSVQFLGIASSVANALASSDALLGDDGKSFISDTVQIMTEHLLRWGDDAAVKSLIKAAASTPRDVNNGSSALFFTDKPLWLITIYAELAGILQSQDRWHSGFIGLSDDSKSRMRNHLSVLLQFFSARISIQHIPSSRLGIVDLADLDRGYWRLYADNHYAGYEKDERPVVCRFSDKDKTKYEIQVRVPADTVQQRQDTGWDISHARRLVHALDALERNRDAIKSIYSLGDTQLPDSRLPSAFANTLVEVLWNGDTTKPLFSNYWSGANGWFRVAYDNGTGQCGEGYPPYGLTDSFPTGGYITWARYRPVIGLLGQRLYDLISSPEGVSSPFVAKYYPGLNKSANSQAPTLARFMFLPSLVGVTEE